MLRYHSRSSEEVSEISKVVQYVVLGSASGCEVNVTQWPNNSMTMSCDALTAYTVDWGPNRVIMKGTAVKW